MATIPIDYNKPETLIDRGFEESADRKPRPYMGISMIGHECDRYLWLMFRWAVIPSFSGRMYRLFRRGQLEEEQFVNDLKSIGCVMHHTGNDQKEVDFGCWVRGHMDGIIESGLPEAPKKKHVAEFKTHNDASFKLLKMKGVKEAKPMHYAQMQCYMLGEGTDRALYMAVNKNDDELYTERVKLDKDFAEVMVRRGQEIATSPFIPLGISQDPTFYKCNMCPCHEFCHITRQTKELNCRTCRFFVPTEEGKAMCSNYHIEIPLEYQYMACEEYRIHPDLGARNP